MVSPRYSVVIDGDDGSVWPPVPFDDPSSAWKYACKIAKSWEGLNGSPLIRLKIIDGRDSVWTVNEILELEKFLDDPLKGD